MTISERIFSILEEQHKTQSSLAAAINVRVATVSAWKKKNFSPSAEYLVPIADFLGISTDFLLRGKEYDQVTYQGIFGDGNTNNHVAINNNVVTLTEFDAELIRICSELDMRHKNLLLNYAYSLEDKMGE